MSARGSQDLDPAAVAERFEPDEPPGGPIGQWLRELPREAGCWVITGQSRRTPVS